MWGFSLPNNYVFNEREKQCYMNYRQYLLIISLIWELRYFFISFLNPQYSELDIILDSGYTVTIGLWVPLFWLS